MHAMIRHYRMGTGSARQQGERERSAGEIAAPSLSSPPAGLRRSRSRGQMPEAMQGYEVPTRGLLTKAERWLYPDGHPSGLARLLNKGWSIVHASGLLPKRYVTLEVPGRRTGRILSFPLVVADYQGERYLVSMLGESSNWLRNVRAAGGRAVLRHGRREAVRLEEVDPDARAPVVRRYLSLAPGPRAFIPVDPDAPLEDFQKVAPRVPVFRVQSDPEAHSTSPLRRAAVAAGMLVLGVWAFRALRSFSQFMERKIAGHANRLPALGLLTIAAVYPIAAHLRGGKP